jgi:hypothetical protein
MFSIDELYEIIADLRTTIDKQGMMLAEVVELNNEYAMHNDTLVAELVEARLLLVKIADAWRKE